MIATAFVFPGQGSQSLGMLAKAAAEYPLVKEIFSQASDVLKYDLWHLCTEGPLSTLNRTQYTQPALLTAGYALWRVWQEEFPQRVPTVMAGHSLGEYTALVCAQSLSFPLALTLVEQRGKLMQNAVQEGQGGMAALLGLEDDVVIELCRTSSENDVVAPANFNTKGQVVIAGHVAALKRVIQQAKQKGGKAILLPVSVPSHCPLMQTAADNLTNILYNIPFKQPQIPILHNVDTNVHHSAIAIQRALINQLSKPVYWTRTVEKMITEYQVTRFIECGPGKILCGLIKRINKSLACHSLEGLEWRFSENSL